MASSTSELDIVVQLKDQASKAMADIGGSIKANLDGIQTAANTVALSFGAMGAGILGGGYLILDQARQSMQVENQLKAVLASTGGVAGVTADEAKSLAEHFQSLTNYDNDAVLSAENLILTFTNIKDDIFPQTTQVVLDMSAALHQDLQSSAIEVGKALQDPILGVTALRRVGVNFNEDQQKVIENLVNTGHAAEAQAMILKELNTEFGGSAAAQADAFTQLKNSVMDVAKELGKALLPAVNEIAAGIRAFIEGPIGQWIQAHPQITAAILLSVGALGFLFVGIGAVAGAVSGAIQIWKAGSAAVELFGVALEFVAANPIVLIIAAIVALGVGIYELITHWQQVADFTRKVWDDIAGFVDKYWKEIMQTLLPGVGALVVFITQNLGTIQAAWDTVWGAVSSYFVGIWDGIRNSLASAIGFLRDTIGAFVSWASSVFQPVLSTVSAVGNAASSFGKAVAGGASAVASVIGIHDAIITPGGQIIQSDPADFLIATKTPGSLVGGGGSSINIYIQGGNYLDSQGATMIANQLAKQIVRQIKVRNYAT